MKLTRILVWVLSAVLPLLTITRPLCAQTTVGTGGIVGTVSDPSGAVVSGATVRITNAATGQLQNLVTNSSGSFNSGALVPGDYKIQISSKGFNSVEATMTVLVGNTATLKVSLKIGSEDQVLEVQSSALRVNTEQPPCKVF